MTHDTVELLKECNAGVKMGVSAIAKVEEQVESDDLREILFRNKEAHQRLGSEIHRLLNRQGEGGKNPTPVAKGMSWLKTNMKMTAKGGDDTVADLITDGGNMGVKSLSRYLNQYAAADETSKDIARRLIGLEESLAREVRSYL